MDPDANLSEQLELARSIIGEFDRPNDNPEIFMRIDAARLAELVIALDEWLSKGGFKPARWA